MTADLQLARRDLAFRTYAGRKGFMDLREPWQRLESEAQLEFYQTYDWYKCLLDHLATDADEYIFVSASLGTLVVGIFPFQRKTETRLGCNYRLLELPNHPHVIIRDIPLHPDVVDTDILILLVAYLKTLTRPGWDALRIAKIQLGSALDRLCRTVKGTFHHTAPAGSNYVIDCAGSFDDNLAHVSSRFRRNLRRLRKRAEAMGKTRFIQCIEEDALDEAIKVFFAVEHDSWKSESGFSIASHQNLMNFYRAVSRVKGQAHHCQMNLMQVGEDTVSAQFGIRSRATFYMLKIGYRQAYSDIGPGNLLLNHTIEHFSNDADIDLVSLVTSPEWAEKWKSREIPLVSHFIYRPSLKGTVAGVAGRVKSFLRSRQERKGAAQENQRTVPDPEQGDE
ncbi:MAG: GNAT family N-acetyltransferase [Woeseia sp.]